MNKQEQEIYLKDYWDGFAEAAKRDAEALEKAALESKTLIKENIDLTLKNQKACELLSGNCKECPADGVTCHRDAEDHECWNRVDLALGKMVKGEVVIDA